MDVIKAPREFSDAPRPMVFLAGSIELGEAPDWRATIVQALEPYDLTLLNPWRDDWDNSWEQRVWDEKFKEQVDWELAALGAADLIFMYFAPGTTAPITLLEFGLFADSGKLIVCCPEGFWRTGNVEMVCESYGIPIVNSLEEAVADILERIG